MVNLIQNSKFETNEQNSVLLGPSNRFLVHLYHTPTHTVSEIRMHGPPAMDAGEGEGEQNKGRAREALCCGVPPICDKIVAVQNSFFYVLEEAVYTEF